jgi:beta-lactamase regulating signal transducer with metallopeptidase domain
MMQYLLNVTLTWLFSLLIFDLFLRKDTFHQYNRYYLLTTLLAGSLVPLFTCQPETMIRSETFRSTLVQAAAAKNNLQLTSANTVSHVPLSSLAVLQTIYLIGVAISFLLLLKEVYQLSAYYRRGIHSNIQGWTIIETGQAHAPFSLLHLLFIQSRQQYDADEWGMIITHESQHARQLHIVDLLLLHIMKSVFWFHPAVYIYSKRILIIHEYQADASAKSAPMAYGKFLIEQSLLLNAPAITHSLNYSPVKNRIIMLTRKSSSIAKSKLLLFIPLAIISLLLFTKQGFSTKATKEGNIVHFNGNTVELTQELRDTIPIEDPVTGEVTTKVIILDPNPVKLNGQRVYRAPEVQYEAAYNGKENALDEYLMNGIQGQLNGLPDGSYRFTAANIVIDKNGKLVYYEIVGPTRRDLKTFADLPVDDKLKKKLQNTLSELLTNAPRFKPAKQNGQAVDFLLTDSSPFTRMQSFYVIDGHFSR